MPRTTTKTATPKKAEPETDPTMPPRPDVKVELQLITPELAQQWLQVNFRNRNQRPKQILAHTRDMLMDAWRFIGDTIKFSSDGRLLDGQHRLEAIVKARTPQWLIVVFGIDPDAFDVIDAGAKRTGADMFKLAGYRYPTLLASVASMALTQGGVARKQLTHSELLRAVREDPDLYTVVNEEMPRLLALDGLASGTVIAYSYYRLAKIDDQSARVFFDGLNSLAQLPAHSPILALHRHLPKIHQARGGRGAWSYRLDCLAAIYTAWNAWRDGEAMDRIRPQIVRGKVQVPEPK